MLSINLAPLTSASTAAVSPQSAWQRLAQHEHSPASIETLLFLLDAPHILLPPASARSPLYSESDQLERQKGV